MGAVLTPRNEYAADGYQRIVRIERCRVMFAVPLDTNGFGADLESDARDFVRSCCPEWPRYRREVIDPAMKVIGAAREFGAGVLTDATLDDWSAMLRQPLDLVVLVAHWLDNTINFATGCIQSMRSSITSPPASTGRSIFASAIPSRSPSLSAIYSRTP